MFEQMILKIPLEQISEWIESIFIQFNKIADHHWIEYSMQWMEFQVLNKLLL